MNGENLLSTERFKELRRNISNTRKLHAANWALDHFSNLREMTLSFASFGTEIDLWPLNRYLMEKNLLVLPRIEKDTLALYHVKNLNHLAHSKWGILEPLPSFCKKLHVDNISTALVPGLAFDRSHHRKGYGEGYYDRLLSKAKKMQTIGIGFKEQLVEGYLTVYEGDVPLDSLSLF